jgi:DNA-binding NarL/FixJ family response regulator
LIAGTHKLFRDGLKCLIKRHFGEKAEIDEADVGECKSVCNDFAPDVLLLDVDIKQGVGLKLASQLAGSSARPKVMVITGKSDPILLNLLMETSFGYMAWANCRTAARQWWPGPS